MLAWKTKREKEWKRKLAPSPNVWALLWQNSVLLILGKHPCTTCCQAWSWVISPPGSCMGSYVLLSALFISVASIVLIGLMGPGFHWSLQQWGQLVAMWTQSLNINNSEAHLTEPVSWTEDESHLLLQRTKKCRSLDVKVRYFILPPQQQQPPAQFQCWDYADCGPVRAPSQHTIGFHAKLIKWDMVIHFVQCKNLNHYFCTKSQFALILLAWDEMRR